MTGESTPTDPALIERLQELEAENRRIKAQCGQARQLAAEAEFLLSVFESIEDGISVLDRDFNILRVNPWMERRHADQLPLVGKKCYQVYQSAAEICAGCPSLQALESGETQTKLVPSVSGNQSGWLELSAFPLRDPAGQITGIIEHVKDVSQRVQSESELRQIKELNESIIQHMREGIVLQDTQGNFTFANPTAAHTLGYETEELIGQHWTYIIPPDQHVIVSAADQRRVDGQADRYELALSHKNGSRVPVQVSGSPRYDGESGQFIGSLAVFTDISKRKKTEQALRENEALLRSIFRAAPTGIGLVSERILQQVNEKICQMTGYSQDELLGQSARMLYPSQAEYEYVGQEKYRQIREMGSGTVETRWQHKDGHLLDVLLSSTPIDPNQLNVGVTFTALDITDRKQAEAQLNRQVRRLAALRQIDIAITGSMDLNITLNVLLDQTITQLDVDAAAVLLLNPHTQILEYAAGRGFHTDALPRSRVRLGKGMAGRAALQRKTIAITDLRNQDFSFKGDQEFASEGFVAYFGVPLVVKGQVMGVLEVFQRQTFNPGQDWLSFLEALAGQAAIAIDSAELFERLQRSNLELTLAYHNTLEGWAHALELRDMETKGHSQRVTELTLHLARAMGIPDEDLTHVYRGALLHDIGKMGIPDQILHKNGPLTEAEMQLMQQHPLHAYKMLSPIEFLRPALAIPYCHHERWDGSGYPRGLKGTEIPLAARVFAVVDVWDALRSHRPYRDAWEDLRALEHIRAEAGSHFDPQVVDAFLTIVDALD